MAKPSYRTDSKYFRFYNRNPKGLLSTGDCVIRAISTATGRTWEQTLTELTSLGIQSSRMFHDKVIYSDYLINDCNFTKFKQPRKSDNTKYTLKEFCIKNPKGIFVINLANHLTIVSDGLIYDTWNCERKSVGNYWHSKS